MYMYIHKYGTLILYIPVIFVFLFACYHGWNTHYSNVIMGAMVSHLTAVSIVCSIVCSGADQRKHQSPASLAFVREIHRWPSQRGINAENVSILWLIMEFASTQIIYVWV